MADRTRVLVADDDPHVRFALGLLFERLPGCALAGAVATADEAVEAVRRLGADVLVMDAELPGALAAVAAVRATAHGRSPTGVPRRPQVVLLSVYGTREREALAAGADAYLLKDCGRRDLAVALHRAVAPAQAGSVSHGDIQPAAGGVASGTPLLPCPCGAP